MDNSVYSQSSKKTAPQLMVIEGVIFYISGQEPQFPQPPPASPRDLTLDTGPATATTTTTAPAATPPDPSSIHNKDNNYIHLETVLHLQGGLHLVNLFHQYLIMSSKTNKLRSSKVNHCSILLLAIIVLHHYRLGTLIATTSSAFFWTY
jgi:hypothetical protein